MTTHPTEGDIETSDVRRLGLFDGFGVEIELMIVAGDDLSVMPICDRLIEAVAGEPGADLERGDIAWSNELVLHVLELKTNGPAPSLAGLAGRFHENVLAARVALEPFGARLMPGGMHPWMDPARETKLWPHEYTDVYHTFDRIFGCSGHGWANLQSTHVNLPFADDEEFARLHAAIRLVLPLIPALAAASPVVEGRIGPGLDSRLVMYRGNARRVPSVAGRIVPEPAANRADYEQRILGRIYEDLAPLDPEGVLRHEWANARGAIARFERGAIEIRLIDSQECPSSDLAVVAAVVEVVRALATGSLSSRDLPVDPSTESLAALLDAITADADEAQISDSSYLSLLGLPSKPMSAGEAWRRLMDAHPPADPAREWSVPLGTILERGPLARRIGRALGPTPSADALHAVYHALCDCLDHNEPYLAKG